MREQEKKAGEDRTGEEVADAVGNLYRWYCVLRYRFLLACGVIGLVAYYQGWWTFLYGMTLVTVVVYLATHPSVVGLLWPIGAAVIGELIWGELTGACAGIMAMWILRHFIRSLWLGLIGKIIACNSK